MSWQNITAKDLQKVVRKLSLERGAGKRSAHPVYWYYLDGKKTLRVTMPNVHGGSSAGSVTLLATTYEQRATQNKQPPPCGEGCLLVSGSTPFRGLPLEGWLPDAN